MDHIINVDKQGSPTSQRHITRSIGGLRLGRGRTHKIAEGRLEQIFENAGGMILDIGDHFRTIRRLPVR